MAELFTLPILSCVACKSAKRKEKRFSFGAKWIPTRLVSWTKDIWDNTSFFYCSFHLPTNQQQQYRIASFRLSTKGRKIALGRITHATSMKVALLAIDLLTSGWLAAVPAKKPFKWPPPRKCTLYNSYSSLNYEIVSKDPFILFSFIHFLQL